MKPNLPTGTRVDDPPPKESTLRFRLALAARKHPVGLAMTIALLVVAVPVVLLIQSNHELRTATQTVQHSQRDLITASRRVQSSRRAVTSLFCAVINQNGEANNRQTRYIQQLIVGGARQSAVFEPLYKAFHAPPYNLRLKQAKAVARNLNSSRVTKIKCGQLERRIEAAAKGKRESK